MFYTIYKTSNKVNGKWYIGYHATEDLNDSYLGSGKNLKKAIKKYGEEAFFKQVLYVFPTKEEALQKEAELVTEYVVKDKNSYNVKEGGEGGWSHIVYLAKNDKDWRDKRYENTSNQVKQLHKEGKLKGWKELGVRGKSIKGFKGKNHTEETKRKISENNGMKLDPSVIQQRIDQFNSIEKKWGYIKQLSEMWNTSHTTVRRFLKHYDLL